jgi:hypothetical protein
MTMQTIRRFPIDFRAIAKETGCTRGTIGYNDTLGWHVQNGNGPADFAKITAPALEPGEKLRIEDGKWCVYEEVA